MANIHRDKESDAAGIDDFLIDWWSQGQSEPEPQSVEEQRSIIEMMKLVFEKR